jgi:ABC-type iron transport system FetAB ATPase subunit
MTEIMIEADHVVKFLGVGAGKVQALKGVSLSLKGGELALLMGPSGSGKTTLLSVLGCMLSPTAGTVRIHGQATSDMRPEELASFCREMPGLSVSNPTCADRLGTNWQKTPASTSSGQAIFGPELGAGERACGLRCAAPRQF